MSRGMFDVEKNGLPFLITSFVRGSTIRVKYHPEEPVHRQWRINIQRLSRSGEPISDEYFMSGKDEAIRFCTRTTSSLEKAGVEYTLMSDL